MAQVRIGNSNRGAEAARELPPLAGPSPSLPLVLALLALCGPQVACAPVVDFAGVYFPSWLVSAVVGLVLGYVTTLLLDRGARTRGLSQSGLLFLALAVGIALFVWWVFYSRF